MPNAHSPLSFNFKATPADTVDTLNRRRGEETMAVTNRAKGAAKTPAWAVRGKLRLAHVPGGPAEAARLVYSGLWDKTPAGLLSAGRYSAELVNELVARKINAVCLTWSPGFSLEGDVPQWELVAALLPLLKKKKIRAIADISLTGCFAAEFLPRVPEAKSWLERQPDGKPIAHRNDNCLQMNVHHDGWRQYIAHKVRMAAGAGFDGFFFSDVFAAEHESAECLAWLREVARSGRPAEPGADEPLLYSASARPGIAATANLKWLPSGTKPMLDPQENQSNASNILALKTLFELAGRDIAFVSGMPDSASEKVCRVAAAEILACGGACHGTRVPAQYQAFFMEHAELFGSADPINSVGLLIDPAALPPAEAAKAMDLLLRHGIQFDVIPAPELEKFDLKKYRAISTALCPATSEAAMAALKTFTAQQSGTLLECRGDASAELRSVVETGKGRTITYRAPLSGDAATAWLADLQAFGGAQPVEVQTPGTAIAFLWGKGTRRWVHFINYASKPCAATVALPGCGGRKLTAFSPDDHAPELVDMETGTAHAKFTLKGLDTYAIVEVN